MSLAPAEYPRGSAVRRAALLLLLTCPVAAAQVDTTTPTRVTLTGPGGVALGQVVLGSSHVADVRQLLDSVGGLGPRRANGVTFKIGPLTLHPPDLYTPPATMNQLYFDHDVLLLVVEGVPRGLPASRAAFEARYPDAHETQRAPGWVEMQTQLADCVWLIAVFTDPENTLESDGYGYVCAKR